MQSETQAEDLIVRFCGGMSSAQRQPDVPVGYQPWRLAGVGSVMFGRDQRGGYDFPLDDTHAEDDLPNENHSGSALCRKCQAAWGDLEPGHFVLSEADMNDVDPAQLARVRKLPPLSRALENMQRCPSCRLVVRAAKRFPELVSSPEGTGIEATLRLDTVFTYFSESTNTPRSYSFRVSLKFTSNNLDYVREQTGIGGGRPQHVVADLVLVQSDPIAMNSRFGRPVETGNINITLLTKWLHNCDVEHLKYCGKASDAPQTEHQNMDAIDVTELCIVSATTEVQYFALSYVWGQAQAHFRRECSNDQLLKTRNGLKSVWEKIPVTIRDAIQLVQSLGGKYLWVDALCIVQDDEASKAQAIRSMAAIYTKAYATIVAASGQDANSGLPGVRQNSRDLNVAEWIKPDLRLMVDETGLELDRSDWTYWERAWTYQEQMLSNRMIIFANQRVYWQCPILAAQEDIANYEGAHPILAERDGPIEWRGLTEDLTYVDDAFEQYVKIVEKYCSMKIGNDSDILNAFQGVADVLSLQSGMSFYGGMPAEWLDLALLWEPTKDSTRRHGQPSWSWCGWRGPIQHSWQRGYIPHVIDPWFRRTYMSKAAWIQWQRFDSDIGRYTDIPRPNEDQYPSKEIAGWITDGARFREDLDPDSDATIQMALDSMQMYFRPEASPKERKTISSYPPYRELLEKSLGLVSLAEYPDEATQNTASSKTDSMEPTHPSALLLKLRSIHVRLEIRKQAFEFNWQKTEGLESFDVHDKLGEWCGVANLPTTISSTVSEGVHDFVVLSDAISWERSEYREFLLMNRNPLRDEVVWSMNRLHEAGTSPLNVLLLQRCGACWERLGSGRIFKKAVSVGFDDGAAWKDIVLQ